MDNLVEWAAAKANFYRAPSPLVATRLPADRGPIVTCGQLQQGDVRELIEVGARRGLAVPIGD